VTHCSAVLGRDVLRAWLAEPEARLVVDEVTLSLDRYVDVRGRVALTLPDVRAVESSPGTDPDRASLTVALEAARDQLTAAHDIFPTDPVDLLAVIGRTVLANLLPARRPRYSARKVKCATSRYLNRDDGRPAAATTITAIDVTIHTPPLDLASGRTHRARSTTPRPPQPPTRRQRVTALMTADPARAWTGRELADHPRVPLHNMLTQLAEWVRYGFLARPQRRQIHPAHPTTTRHVKIIRERRHTTRQP
jgi:hypothetical protein